MANCKNKCFISLAVKALKIRRKFKLYTAEKEYAKAGNETDDTCFCTKFSKLLNSVDRPSIGSVKRKGTFDRFLVEDSIENFILKSVFGFLGGILLTYICFMFLVFSLNFTLKRATYICMGLGIILSLGLAFSVKIRCTVFLCIPQLFSKRGRQALLAYAFILALSGPAKNTLHNVEVMSESLACAQEQLKQAENELLKCVHKPNAAAKKSVEKLLEKMNFAVKDFKNFILHLYKTCFDILETVLQTQKWLYSITLLCHKKMGKPAHHCLDLLSDSIENCQAMSPTTPWKEICKIDPGTQESICSTEATAFCMESDVPGHLPVVKLQKQLEVFKHRAMNILYVRMEAHQVYSQSNRSYTYHEEYQGMATEIRQKTDQFLQYFDFMSVIFGIFILVLFVKVIIYRHKFLTEDHYDNRYITSDFVDIDNTRAEFQMETLLPLEPREKMKYIKVTSIRLVPCERVRLLSSFVFLIFATFKIIIHILTDSSLYWILSSVRRDERLLYMSQLREEEPSITVRVVGYGLVAALLRNVTRAVKRQSTTTRLDPTPCLPDPVPPDWNRYYQISLVVICWLLALCEPYGLRLRHTVMVTYHPDRARERAIWLYNRIISNRTSFVKLSRREIRKKYKDVGREATFSFQFMKKKSSPKCLLCRNTISCEKNRVECPTAECVGVYCDSCFASLKFCSICSDPAEYGDLSDLSEEKQVESDKHSERYERTAEGCRVEATRADEGLRCRDSSEEECLRKDSQNRASRLGNRDSKESEKRKLLLNLKRPSFKLKKECEEKKEKPKSKHLIQPTLLLHAVKFCRNKIPAFRQLKNLSDVESSDWDLGTELSSVEGKRSDSRKSCDESKGKKEKEKKEKKEKKDKKKKEASSSRKKKEKKQEKECMSRKQKKSEKSLKKVCLFQKLSPMVVDKDLTGVYRAPGVEKQEEAEKPDFHFRAVEKDLEEQNEEDEVCGCFSAAKDSLETMQKKKKKKEGLGMKRKCSVGVVLVNQAILKQPVEPKGPLAQPERVEAEEKDLQVAVHPLELESTCSESEMRSKITFPFIDPMNIHEFAAGGGVWGRVEAGKGGVDESTEVKVGAMGLAPRVPYTPRVCYRKSESSESVRDSVRLCIKDDPQMSSTESECQFYSQPYRSSNSSSEQAESVVKRASGKTNLKFKTAEQSAFFSIETDSSNDKFLSVKPSRRVRRKPGKAREPPEQSDILLNLLARPSPTHSKTVDFLKAKLVHFFKKEGNSSDDGGSSDMEDRKFLLKTTLFLSEEEFQRISKEISLRRAQRDFSGRQGHFTCTGLLSELPCFYHQCFTETSTDGE